MPLLKNSIRKLAAKLGYEISRREVREIGISPFSDMKQFVPLGLSPIILDIGANVGQSAKRFREWFPSSVVHSFEPSSETFQKLRQNVSHDKNIFPVNCAVGASPGKQAFQENTVSEMSSFLELSPGGLGHVHKESIVDVTTVDQFLETSRIGHVDILKVDVQGYEFEVLKGADKSMKNNQIGLLHFELIYSNIYLNVPSIDQIFRYLFDRNFSLVTIYPPYYAHRLANWGDTLFVNREYYARTQTSGLR